MVIKNHCSSTYIHGITHSSPEDSIVLVGGRVKDLPGVRCHIFQGTLYDDVIRVKDNQHKGVLVLCSFSFQVLVSSDDTM